MHCTLCLCGSQIRKLKAFDVEGLVIDFYLRADALSHTIRLQLPSSDINNIKNLIRTAPNHVESEYRWPFDGCIAKFISKHSKEKLVDDFEPILDGRGINLKKFTGTLQHLTINDVVEGGKISVEYISIPYRGRKPSTKDD